MSQKAESGNLSQRLSTRLPSLSLDVLFSTPRRISMLAEGTKALIRDLQRPDPEGVGLSTVLALKANTGNEMARTPYVTVRGPEPTVVTGPPSAPDQDADGIALSPKPKETTMATEPEPVEVEEDTGPPMPDPVEFDVEKASGLLDIVLECKDLPVLSALSGSAMQQLVKMNKEVADETAKLQEEWKAEYAEWEAKKKKEAEEKRKKEAEEAKEKEDA